MMATYTMCGRRKSGQATSKEWTMKGKQDTTGPTWTSSTSLLSDNKNP